MEPFIGQIQAFGFSFAPRGWAKCDGQLLQIASNQALFSLLGTTYGGDGRTTFGLPDLRGRTALHVGQGAGLTKRVLGATGGAESVVLTANQMPAHTHAATLRAAAETADTSKPQGKVLGSAQFYRNPPADTNLDAGAITVANSGGNQAHPNMQPFVVVNWCIALTGVFPSRS